MRHLALALALLAGPAGAAEPVTPDGFVALAEGRTLHFTLDGEPYRRRAVLPGPAQPLAVLRRQPASRPLGRRGRRDLLRLRVRPGAATAGCSASDGAGFSARLVENGAETGFVLDLSDRRRADALPRPRSRQLRRPRPALRPAGPRAGRARAQSAASQR